MGTQRARATLLACAALFAIPAAADEGMGDSMRGQALFVTKGCVQCHAVRGAGGRIGPDLGRMAVKSSFYELAAALWNHSLVMSDKMKEFRLARPKFEGEELKDLLAFLYFLNYFDEAGDEKAGKLLFAEMHCVRCHQLGGEGGTEGPSLQSLPRGTPPLQIAQALWNHGPRMVSSMQKLGLKMPTFQGTQINDLFAYLRSQGPRQETRSFHSAGDPAQGEKLFTEKGCARCHEMFGKEPGIGPDLGTSELRGSVTQLAGRMWNHWPAMNQAMGVLGMEPPKFHEDELANVFAYIFVSRYDGQKTAVGDGRTVYLQKGCGTCHGAGGAGAIGPPLRDRLKGEAKEAVVQRLWNHAPQMRARMTEQRIPWPRFDAPELSALLKFLANGWDAAPASADTIPPKVASQEP